MVVRIRLARHGHRNNPIFHLVAISGRKRRSAKPLEQLGLYIPRPVFQVHRPNLIDLVQTVSSRAPAAQAKLRQGFAEGGLRVSRKEVRWDVDRIRYWLGVGAQPSDSAMKLLRTGGIVNDWADLEVLRTRTTAEGTQPKPPALRIATTKRSPQAALSKFRRRGLLPVETKQLPDGGIELPGSITADGNSLHLSPSEVTSALSRANRQLLTSPTTFLDRRHKPPTPPAKEGEKARKTKRDPAWWKLRRRSRAVAYSLVRAGRGQKGQISSNGNELATANVEAEHGLSGPSSASTA